MALGEEEQCGGGADTCEEHRALLRGLGPQTQRPSSFLLPAGLEAEVLVMYIGSPPTHISSWAVVAY